MLIDGVYQFLIIGLDGNTNWEMIGIANLKNSFHFFTPYIKFLCLN